MIDDAGETNPDDVNHGGPPPSSGSHPATTGEREEPGGFRLPSGGRPGVRLVVVTVIGDPRSQQSVGRPHGPPAHRHHAVGTTRRYVSGAHGVGSFAESGPTRLLPRRPHLTDTNVGVSPQARAISQGRSGLGLCDRSSILQPREHRRSSARNRRNTDSSPFTHRRTQPRRFEEVPCAHPKGQDRNRSLTPYPFEVRIRLSARPECGVN